MAQQPTNSSNVLLHRLRRRTRACVSTYHDVFSRDESVLLRLIDCRYIKCRRWCRKKISLISGVGERISIDCEIHLSIACSELSLRSRGLDTLRAVTLLWRYTWLQWSVTELLCLSSNDVVLSQSWQLCPLKTFGSPLFVTIAPFILLCQLSCRSGSFVVITCSFCLSRYNEAYL